MPILPKERDTRLIAVRRGGTLTDEHHALLAEWAAICAERVLPLFEQEQPGESRPREAIEVGRAWIRGEARMGDAHRAAFAANAAARGLPDMARFAALAAGQAVAVAHVAAHDLGAAAYAIRAACASALLVTPKQRGSVSVTGRETGSRRTPATSFWTISGAGARSAGTSSMTDRPCAHVRTCRPGRSWIEHAAELERFSPFRREAAGFPPDGPVGTDV